MELISLEISGILSHQNQSVSDYRNADIIISQEKYKYKEIDYEVKTTYSKRYINKINALLNLFNTFFVCGLLFCSIFLMNQDFSKLILNPLERMIERIK